MTKHAKIFIARTNTTRTYSLNSIDDPNEVASFSKEANNYNEIVSSFSRMEKHTKLETNLSEGFLIMHILHLKRLSTTVGQASATAKMILT